MPRFELPEVPDALDMLSKLLYLLRLREIDLSTEDKTTLFFLEEKLNIYNGPIKAFSLPPEEAKKLDELWDKYAVPKRGDFADVQSS